LTDSELYRLGQIDLQVRLALTQHRERQTSGGGGLKEARVVSVNASTIAATHPPAVKKEEGQETPQRQQDIHVSRDRAIKKEEEAEEIPLQRPRRKQPLKRGLKYSDGSSTSSPPAVKPVHSNRAGKKGRVEGHHSSSTAPILPSSSFHRRSPVCSPPPSASPHSSNDKQESHSGEGPKMVECNLCHEVFLDDHSMRLSHVNVR
jgi:hypothetical protein